jgi:hypothetical protein
LPVGDFSSRLIELIGNRTQREFAQWLDEPPARINHYLKTDRDPAADFLRKLSLRDVNVNWLLTGRGEMYSNGARSVAEFSSELQHLLHEVEGQPELALHLAELARSIKEGARIEGNLEWVIEKLKKSVVKKKGK